MRYQGTKDQLAADLAAHGFQGTWEENGGKTVFRSEKGGVLNFWPNSRDKTVQVQGRGDANTLRSCMEELQEGRTPFSNPVVPGQFTTVATAAVPRAKVFLVHGHDREARDQLELVLHRLQLQPFVLQNTSGGGMTIIEALEREILADEGPQFGIVLMTPPSLPT